MGREKVLLVVGALLVLILAGILGNYSAWGSPRWGFTYRVNNWGGISVKTDSRFAGELLLYYEHGTNEQENYQLTITGLYPSLTYHFGGPSATSPYVGLGYYSYTSDEKALIESITTSSGFTLLTGIEHFFNKNFSCDLRLTAYLKNWRIDHKANGVSWPGSNGIATQILINLGLSIFL